MQNVGHHREMDAISLRSGARSGYQPFRVLQLLTLKFESFNLHSHFVIAQKIVEIESIERYGDRSLRCRVFGYERYGDRSLVPIQK